MIYLHKLLPLIVSPMGLILFLMLLELRYRRKWTGIAALLVLIVFSLPLTGSLIWRSLESDYRYKPVEAAKQHDAIVVLSGMLDGFYSGKQFVPQWNDADRFFAGVSLIKANKAKILIFTRGKMPWSNSPPEGEILKSKAIEMGVDASRIYLTGVANNTEGEAREIAAMMKRERFKSILLVTSSFHMPRAKLLFDNAGVESEAYPTDFREANSDISWLDFIPSADGFKHSSSGIREYIGRAYYQLKFG